MDIAKRKTRTDEVLSRIEAECGRLSKNIEAARAAVASLPDELTEEEFAKLDIYIDDGLEYIRLNW